jgi:ethanolamine utilization microcompartment shell protein EutL
LESDEGEYSKANDEEAPKPTVDVLMSRNLRSGAGKGFNFLAMESSDDDQE